MFRSRTRMLAGLGLVLAVGTLASACASHSAGRKEFFDALVVGNYEQADIALGPEDKVSEEDQVPYYMDKGMALHLGGRVQESDAWLDKAEMKIDELFTESVTDKLQAIFWNDSSKAYAGEEFERVMVNVVRGYNYLTQDDVEKAAVEFRKVSKKLQFYTDRVKELQLTYKYTDDGYAHYLAAMCAEAFGSENEALVSFRNAVKAYVETGATFDIQTPPEVVADALRITQANGVEDGVAAIRQSFPNAEASAPLAEGEGEIVVIAGVGAVAFKVSKKFMHVDGQGDTIAVTYPSFTRRAFQAASVSAQVDGGAETPAVVGTNLSNIAIQVMNDRNMDVKDEAMARAIAMYAVKKVGRGMAQSDNVWVKSIGAVMNIAANVRDVLEVADTRSWLSLPDTYQIARMRVPAGEHKVSLHVKNRAGAEMYPMPDMTVSVPSRGKKFIVVHTRETVPPPEPQYDETVTTWGM